jgi:hypothetical protein
MFQIIRIKKIKNIQGYQFITAMVYVIIKDQPKNDVLFGVFAVIVIGAGPETQVESKAKDEGGLHWQKRSWYLKMKKNWEGPSRNF